LFLGDTQGALETCELGLKKCGKENVALTAQLAELLISTGDLVYAEKCINTLRATAVSLRQQGYVESQIGFARGADVLSARLCLARRETTKAIELLQQFSRERKGQIAGGAFAYQALMLLGTTYVSQGLQDKAATTFAEAATVRATSTEAHLAAASA